MSKQTTVEYNDNGQKVKAKQIVRVPGDAALSKLLKVQRQTVIKWREQGKITAKPVGELSNGRPAYFSYSWPEVIDEIKRNVKNKKIIERI